MKLSFTTLSCPGLSFEKVLDIAQEEGYEGIELRGIQDELDNTRLAPFSRGDWRQHGGYDPPGPCLLLHGYLGEFP